MTLHLVRRGAVPIAEPADWIVDLETMVVDGRGDPPRVGPITHDQLVELVVAARRVVTW